MRGRVSVARIPLVAAAAAVVVLGAAGLRGEQTDAARVNPLDPGWEAVRIANWGGAIEVFESYDTDTPDPEVRAEALFALGHIWQHRRPGEDMAKALAYYRRVLEQFPGSKAAPWAELTLARIADLPETEPKTDEARRALRKDVRQRYRRILERYEGHLVTHEAALRLAVSYFVQVGDAEAERTGAEILKDHLKAHPDKDHNYLVANMHILVGEWHERNRRWAAAVTSFQAAYKAGLPSMFHQAKTCFRIAQIAEYRLGEDRLATQWYERLVDEASQDSRYYLAQRGAERCRARLAEAQRGESP
ncbi:MAG: tetratricopeptide repeat protein [Planctomycetota bacterium]